MIRPNDNNQHPRATTPSHLDRWLRRREYPKRQSSFGATRSDPLARIYPPISIAKDCFFFLSYRPRNRKRNTRTRRYTNQNSGRLSSREPCETASAAFSILFTSILEGSTDHRVEAEAAAVASAAAVVRVTGQHSLRVK